MRSRISKFQLFLTMALCASMLFVAGCKRAPVYNVMNAPIADTTSTKLSTDSIEKAIVSAGAGLGWKIHKVQEGIMEGVLDIRVHRAVINIAYDSETYSISYKDSTNLKYDGTKIHRNYNNWIHNLDRAIQAQLSQELIK